MTIYFDKEHNAYGDEASIVGKEIVYTCDEELWQDFNNNPDKYIWQNNELVLNPNYEEEKIAELKQAKYTEANKKAFEYLESGEAVYEFEESKSIEATDGNIAKLGLALVNFIIQQDYTSTIEWNTKENENVQLNAEALQGIVAGLQGIQANVWTVKFPAYNEQIANAQTIEEVQAIVIDYGAIEDEDTADTTE